MIIDLKVSRHPSGNLTLMRKDEGESSYKDCVGLLRANSDAGSFYREVALMLHQLHRDGHNISYRDTSVS